MPYQYYLLRKRAQNPFIKLTYRLDVTFTPVRFLSFSGFCSNYCYFHGFFDADYLRASGRFFFLLSLKYYLCQFKLLIGVQKIFCLNLLNSS